MTSTRVVLAIGSNVGDSWAVLQGAVDGLAAHTHIELLGVSPVYETDPVGGPAQDAFLNAIIIAQTSLKAGDLLSAVHVIEDTWQRTRLVRWGPRTLDIDIITFGECIQDTPDLCLPHPRAIERAFVLVPWLDVDPSATLPGSGAVACLDVVCDSRSDPGGTGVRRLGSDFGLRWQM